VEPDERTRDIYEAIEGYPPALPVPLPPPGDLESLAEAGLRLTALSRGVTRAALAWSGFDAFLRRLPETAETLLRRHELRAAYLYAPVISGTLALADDARGLSAIDRAATLLLAARSLHDDIRAGRLPPDRHKDQVLEMGQYPNLFGTSLIVDQDSPRGRIFKTSRLDQITVIAGRRIYVLDLADLGAGTTFAQLREALAEIAVLGARNRLPADELPVGVLTAADHPTQCKIFRQLRASEGNRDSLAALRHSLLTLCLDLDARPATDGEAAALAHSGNPANRWYHQSLQIVVFGNGKACAICNFATYVDGNVMMRGSAELQRRGSAVAIDARPAATALPPARELSWEIEPELVALALQDVRAVQDNQQSTFDLDGIGRTFFRKHGLDPIGAFVVALQMAAQRVSRAPIEIKQMLTMARHRCTDFRSASVSTPEVMRFVEEVESGPVEQRSALLQEAVASQASACRVARRQVPLAELLALFLASRKGLAKFAATVVLGAALRLLALLRLYQPVIHQVLISHPTIHPEVPVVGRPGVRLPYLEAFTVHYQIFDETIRVTLAPSVVWLIPNVELVAELGDSLRRLRMMLEPG
jgi:hypothetical protein